MKTGQQFTNYTKSLGKRLPLVGMVYRFFRDRRYILQQPKLTPLGFRLVGNGEMQGGTFEVELVELVTRYLGVTDTFIDIGANIGFYCCISLSRGNSTIAFEPLPLNLRYLLRNIRANHWEGRIEVFPIALGNSTGVIEIFGSGTAASLVRGWAQNSRVQKQLVPISTLDTVLAERMEGRSVLILIDAEGSEHNILEGAKRFLSFQPKPIWIVEIAVFKNQPRGQSINPKLLSTFQIFWDNGYDAWTADKEQRQVSPKEIMSVCETMIDTLHTHNFLFIDKAVIS